MKSDSNDVGGPGGLPMDDENPFLTTRHEAEARTKVGQERNRIWWETKPMTYADWAGEDRIPETNDALAEIEQTIIGASPYLREQYDFSVYSGQTVLDIGCGSGALSSRLAKNGAAVTAIDLTQAAVELTKKNSGIQGLSIQVARADAEKLPLKSGSFDRMFSWGVLHHTENFQAALDEVARILKPGGSGMMMVYYRNSIVYYLHGLFWLIAKGKLFRGYGIHTVQDFYTDGYYHRYFTARELSSCLIKAALTPLTFEVTQYQKKILPLVPKWLDQALKRRFGMCLVATFEKPPGNSGD